MIRCCLCRQHIPRGGPLYTERRGGSRGYHTLEPTALPGTGYRCIDRQACSERVQAIVAAHQQLGEACK